MTRESEAAIDAYIRRLLWALQALPHDDRLNIASEIHGHLSDCAARGADEQERAQRRLGSPDRLARSYVEEYELAGAVNRASPWTLLLSVLNRATRSLLAFCGGLTAVILYFFALAFALIAVAKLIVPAHVGAWVVGDHLLSLGLDDTPHIGERELLGYWIVPLAIVVGAACFVGAGKLLRLIGLRLLARVASPPIAE